MSFYKKISAFYNLAFFYFLVSSLLRIVLLLHPITQSSFYYTEILKIFSLGLLNDIFVFIISSLFLWLYLIFISNSKYNNPFGYIILGGFITLFFYVASGKSILDEYGGALPEIVMIFIGIKTILFALLLFLPKKRNKIRFWLFAFVLFLYVLLILQNALSEYFFWNEFGVKYNFIAVNYLIYTNEVIGEYHSVLPCCTYIFCIVSFNRNCYLFHTEKIKNLY